jgi:hypothetical protein
MRLNLWLSGTMTLGPPSAGINIADPRAAAWALPAQAEAQKPPATTTHPVRFSKNKARKRTRGNPRPSRPTFPREQNPSRVRGGE